MRFIRQLAVAAALGVGLVSCAQAHVFVGIGVGLAPAYPVVPMVPAAPVYVAPPVYYAAPPPPVYTSQAYSVFSHRLSIRIADAASGKEVYSVTSAAQVDDPSLLRAMPYLVRGAFASFPLQNGTVFNVRVPVEANGSAGVPTNERAVRSAPAAASGAAFQ